MRVLLVSANTFTSPYPVYPLGLDYVAAAISDRHRVEIADMNDLGGKEKLGRVIENFCPDIVGISLRNVDNTDFTDVKEFIGHYKDLTDFIAKASGAKIVLGGSGFTIFPEELMKALDADFGIIGEGERFSLLLDILENKKSKNTGFNIPEIPGIIGKNFSSNEKFWPKPWQGNFKRNFSPRLSHINFYIKRGGMLNLQTKRGCPMKCIYCTYPHIEGKKLRYVAPDEAAAYAVKLQQAGAKYFFITDASFNCDYGHSLAVAKAFKKAGVSIPWGAFFTPTSPPPGYYEKLKECGLTHVEFGTDSMCDFLLKAYGKPFTTKDVFKSHELAVKAGLFVAHYFIFGGPGENYVLMKESLSNIDKLKKTVLFFFCGMRIYPHTRLYDIALRQNLISKSRSLLKPVFYKPDGIKEDEITEMIKEKAKGRPNWIIGSGGPETQMIISRMYEKGFSGPLWEYLIR